MYKPSIGRHLGENAERSSDESEQTRRSDKHARAAGLRSRRLQVSVVSAVGEVNLQQTR
jgi:hypothetical protein